MRAVLRYLLGGIVAPPPLGVPLLALLGTLAFSSLNLVFQAELWPAPPAAPPALELLAGLAALVAAPLLLWWGWG